MKILEVGMGPNMGGIEVYFHNYYKKFSSDFHFDFADKEGGLCFYDEYTADGCKVFHMPDFKRHPIDYYLKLKKILTEGEYDAVHINMLSAANILPVFTGRFSGTKVIAHSHNAGVPSGFSRKILHYVNKPLLQFADVYLACSELAGKWMFGKKTFTVIPNAIDLSVFNINNIKRTEYRNKLGLSEKDLVIGHVGRFAEQKNHGFIIDVFSEIHKESEDYKLLLVGDGERKENIMSRVAELGLTDSVIFTGSVGNVQDYMQAMDAFILPSLFEGLPVTGIEAQACGLPCIFSDAVTKESKITENIVFLPLNNKSEWAEAIKRMAQLPKTDNTEISRAAGYDITESVELFKKAFIQG
ncbi:MAG: glycosyltransferase family 1 protein [Clostridia bacterium]|nr:glycosyltransferase family 1 protein [Clostridia bacterium]